MNGLCRLSDMQQGQSARIISVRNTGRICQRLFELGFIRNTVVECVLRSPFGDPTAFLVHGAVIALRSDDSSNILAEVI